MYRQKDINTIMENIDDIKNGASTIYKSHYEPTINEISKVYNAIKKYIKDNNKIVYGGFAQNLLVLDKNKNDGFYKEIDGAFYNWPDLADIEFYSSTPIDDLVDLTEYLFSLGFKHIEGKEGIHPETYKIFVNFLNYCDITYIPPNIYNNLPVIKVDGVLCAHPHFMMIDAYRILNDPMTSYWRLEKPLKRFQKLIEYYPMNNTNNVDKSKKVILDPIDKEIHRFINKKIIHKSNFSLVGYNAFNHYSKKMSEETYDLQFFEIINNDDNAFEKNARDIYKILNNKFPHKIKIKEFNPFYNFMDYRIEYYYNNKLVLRLYNNYERCTVYNYSQKKFTYYGTFNLTFMYMLYNYFYSIINKDTKQINNYLILCNKLYDIRNNYLEKNNLSVLDNSPFQDFTYKCFGTPKDPIREAFLNYVDKKNKKKLIKFKYSPSGKKIRTPDYMFSNTSGNQVINKKYLIFKNNI